MENKNWFANGLGRAMALFGAGALCVGVFFWMMFQFMPPADTQAENDFGFEVIFQNENEFGNLRVSTGTSFHSPDDTLLVEAEGQAWAVEGVELADDVNVLVVLSNNNTIDNIYDDVVVGMYRVVQ